MKMIVEEPTYSDSLKIRKSQILSTKVTLSVREHVVDVPKIMDLPVRTAMNIFNEPESSKQFIMFLEALADEVEDEVVDVLMDMGFEEAMALVKDWMAKSMPDNGEEPEIV